MRIVYFGDSITDGQLVDRDCRWSAIIDRRLGDGTETFNRGVPGDTTLLALVRIAHSVQALEPDLVLMQFGLNDCNRWETDRGLPRVSERAYAANLRELVDRSHHFGAQVVVLTTHRTTRTGWYEDASGRYAEIARNVAGEAGCTVCDVRQRFMEFDDARVAELLLPDGVHLNEQGHAVYADIVWASLPVTV